MADKYQVVELRDRCVMTLEDLSEMSLGMFSIKIDTYGYIELYCGSN